MATARNVIEFALQADASGLVGPLQKVKGQFGEVEQAAQKAGQQSGAHIDSLGQRMSGLGNKLMGVGAAMTAATLPLSMALKSGVNALMDAEKRAAQTNAVLQSTGQVAGVSAEHVGDLASSLRDMSGVSGGSIREAENLVLTFTNIRNSAGAGRDVFDRTTRAALDMSVAMGTDAKSAAQILGKALNDPAAGLSRLARVGIQFSEQQKEQIKNFQRMGDVASAQGVILDEVAKKYGGSAEAFGKTTAGQFAKADAAFTQMKMTLAAGLAPALEMVAGVLGGVARGFNALDPSIKSVISTAALAVVALGPISVVAGTIVKGFGALHGAIDTLKTKFASLRESGGIMQALKNNWQSLAGGVGVAAAAVGIGLLISKMDEMDHKTRDAEQVTLKSLAGQIRGYGDLQGALDATGRHLDELHRRKQEISDKAGAIPATDAIGTAQNYQALHETITQINEAEKQFDNFGGRLDYVNSVLGTLQNETGMTREQLLALSDSLGQDLSTGESATKFQQMAEAINDVANKSGLTREQVVGLSQSFGVDLTSNTAAAAEKLQQLAARVGDIRSQTGYTTDQLDDFAKKLGIDLKEGGDQASQSLQKYAQWAHDAGYDSFIASGQVDELSRVINATIMPWLNSEQALTSFDLALDQLPESLKRISESHADVTEKQHQGEQAMQQIAAQTMTAYTAQMQLLGANAGTAEGQAALNAILAQGDGALETIAAKLGITKEELEKYRQKLGSIPGLVPTKVTVDTDDANRKLDALRQKLRDVANAGKGTFAGDVVGAITDKYLPGGARGGVIVGDTAHFASGGVFNQATAIVGEGNPSYPEFVIATDPKTKGRNRALWQAAGAHLMADGGVVGTSGGAVGGDGASVGGDAVPVLVQIRDLLAQSLAAGSAVPAAAPLIDPTGGGAPGPAAPGAGGGADATTGAAAAMGALTAAAVAYGAAAQVVTVAEQALDAQLAVSASGTFPALTAATAADDLSTQALTATVLANVPVQAGWQASLGGSQQQLALTTGQVQALTASMQALNATQVVLHVEHSQVEAAGGSIQGLASSVSGALSSLGLSSNQLAQWLGVVLALPSGVLAGAVGAESGGVVGGAGAGMKGHTPTLVMEGSRAYDEYVIPTDPKHRGNAMNLLGGLHQDLGVKPLAMAGGGVVGKVGAAIAATTANAMNTPWGGTGASAPGSLGSATAGSMVAAAAFNAGGGGSQKMVDFAMQQSGDQYVWGAEGPDAWDCSGLVLGAAAAAGLPGLPHYSGSLIAMASPVSVGQGIGTAGALLFHPGHIAISRGDGQTIEARGQAYGVGSWGAEGRFSQAGLLPFPGASGTVGERLPSKWQQVGKYIADRFRAAGVGVGPSVGGEGGEAGGGQFTGKISTFGGPGDFQPTAYGDSTAAMYANGTPYAAMRLAPQGEIPLAPRSWISITKGAASTRAQLLDWGPASWTGRIVDVAPYVADAIGAGTDDTVGVTGLAKGGIIPAGKYDSGGFLPKGLSLAFNGTGQPEPVIPATRTRAEPQIVVNVTVGGSVMAEDDLVDTITSAIQARTRRGYAGVS